MNISRENIDDLNAVIRVRLEPIDYKPKVDSTLLEYRKKARFPGFRPGKVPPSLIKKLYGKSSLAEEIQRLLTENLNTYIHDNQLKILGEPIPNIDSPVIDWDKDETFEFHYDIAIVPDIELKFSENDGINQYRIIITPDMIDKQITNYSRRYGALQPAETISSEDVVKGDLCELSNDDPDHSHNHDLEHDAGHHHPVHSHGAQVYIKSIVDEAVKTQFMGAKVGDKLIFNPNIAFPNETDRANLLKVSREELSEINADFEFTINEISRFSPALVNQELFDKAFGEGTIDSVEAFRERIQTDMEHQFSRESHYKFHIDARQKLMTETDVPLPEAFLKRWMLLSSKDNSMTKEQLETNFPEFAVDLKWSMIKNTIIADQNLEATNEEIREQAIWAIQSSFFQYGIYDAPPEELIRRADALLEKEGEKTRLAESILENKVIDYVKTMFTLVEQNIGLEEFNKLMNENKR